MPLRIVSLCLVCFEKCAPRRLGAFLIGACLVLLGAAPGCRSKDPAPEPQTLPQALEQLQYLALNYRLVHPKKCPSIQELVAEGNLASEKDALDPFGRPLEVFCKDGFPYARSLGADGKLGTADDQQYPPRPN